MQRCESGKVRPGARVWIASLASAAMLVSGGSRMLRSADTSAKTADTKAAKPADSSVRKDSAKNRLTVRAVADRTGQPIADAPIEFRGNIGGKSINKTVRTNRDGVAEFEWKAGAKVRNLFFTARPAKFVPQHYQMRNRDRDAPLPASLELRFEPGTEIGGIVQDESGHPIANATLEIHLPVTWPRLQHFVFQAGRLKTDANGRWRWSEAPADVGSDWANVRHPDYLPGQARLAKSLTNSIALKQGVKLAGRVLDPHKKPIAGATVAMDYDRFGSNEPQAKTDKEGHYVLKNCQTGKTLVTVQAEGFSPKFQEATIAGKTPDLDFELEPGHVLRLRIVDSQGKPVQGAMFAPDTWRSHRSVVTQLNSDAAGKIIWRSAPADAILCNVLKGGYMSVRRKAFTASDAEQVVTLPPQLVVRGRVTNVNTGMPVKNAQIRHGHIWNGNDQTYWNSGQEAVSRDDGTYEIRFSEPAGNGQVLQAVASGYRPATSRVFQPAEGSQTFDFPLRPGHDLAGIILLPDGKPAAGAEVALATPQKRASLNLGRIERSQTQADVAKTDAEGRFSFPTPGGGGFLLIVVHEAGFAEVKNSELDLSTKHVDRITLRPWGRLKGRCLDGKQPDPHREISFSRTFAPSFGRSFMQEWNYQYTTVTDADGRFEFDRVMPGKGTVARVTSTQGHQFGQTAPGWQTPVEIHEGQTAEVTIGGTGRAVSGRLVVDGKSGSSIEWSTNVPISLNPRKPYWPNETRAVYYGKFDKTGRFRIPDVPAGDYTLMAELRDVSNFNGGGRGNAVQRQINIPLMPNGRSDEPLDLGEIRVKVAAP